jgi:nucleotide-binding universal stress UspA family protein
MKKLKHFLVSIDASPFSTAAMYYAIYLAKHTNAYIKALHVVDIVTLEGPFMYDISSAIGIEPFFNFTDQVRAALKLKGETLLQSFEELCEKENIGISTVLQIGIVSKTILKYAEDVDLTIIGKQGVNAKFERGFLGTNIETVLRKADRTLLVVPHHFFEPQHILCGYDGSEIAKRALSWAETLSYYLKKPLIVVIVYNKDRQRAEEIINEAKNTITEHNISYNMVENESPLLGLLDMLKKIEKPLLCLGAYSRTRLSEIILGSTTEGAIKRVEFPILVSV